MTLSVDRKRRLYPGWQPPCDGAQGILINVTGSSTLSLHEIHEASSIIQKAAHEDANIIFGAVQDDAMKESIKVTATAAGFREVATRKTHTRPSYLPKTWKAEREPAPVVPQQTSVVQQVARNVSEVMQEMPADDLPCSHCCDVRRKRPGTHFAENTGAVVRNA